MKTVLIVEDEKMIRQGIKMMVQRSGVPVEVIMECNNGQMAMEVLKNQEVDVMFTDIRMPKMDGIQLVNAIQDLPNKPLVVVISGYDDFSYAVEMLRMGVREYILKPVDRSKITEILQKLDEEIQRMKDNEKQFISHQQLKYLMMNEHITQAEIEDLTNTYEASFYDSYAVWCLNNTEKEREDDEMFICLDNLEDDELYITKGADRETFAQKQLQGRFAGVSRIHSGLAQLPKAFEESKKARIKAFWMEEPVAEYGKELQKKRVLMLEPEPDEKTMIQLAQLLGTERAGEAIETLKRIFAGACAGQYDFERMEDNLGVFFEQIQEVYKNVIKSEEEVLRKLSHIYRYPSASALLSELLAFLDTFVETINNQFNDYKNRQKIQQAIQFILENFDKDLNMAVVSNHISMNYSLFSSVFKQYTGSNFVNYLKELRMQEAKRLLEETELRVNEISQKIGYENEKHFMKIFKSVCGVSPTEYRKNMQFRDNK